MKTLLGHKNARSSGYESAAEKSGARENGRGGRSAFDLLLILLLVFVFMFGVVRPFVAEVFLIPSGSMSPTLKVGDSVLALKFAYQIGEPERGDLAVLNDPSGDLIIKRIVGLPGDKISVNDGVLYVNGERQRESYVNYRLTDSTFFGPEKVPAGHVFLMGDNRSNSRDSRTFGPVPEDDLLGKVVFRIAPIGKIGVP